MSAAGGTGPDDLPRLGSMVGRYRLDGMLGRGGMGVVFRATDMDLGRTVAIKLLSPELADDAAFRERFVRESRLAAAIEHPAIVPVYEAGTMGGTLFIAMRYVPGRDLGRILRAEAPLGIERTLALARPVADALDAAHRRGLIHRDVKPANVLVEGDADERPYLTDFGLSRRMGEQTIASTGGALGTIDYVAPEQISGSVVDGRADQYSLACLVVHCLTGIPPFEGDSEAAVLYAQLNASPPRMSERVPGLPEGLDAPLARALAKDSGSRFSDCRGFIDGLRSATTSPSAPSADDADPGTTSAPRPRPRQRARVVAVAAIAVAAGIVAVGAVVITRGGDPSAPGDVTLEEVTSPAPPGDGANGLGLLPGEVVVFASDRDGDYDLYAVDAEASRPRRLTDAPGDERSPAISPDGSTIAYVAGPELAGDIWLVGVDGQRRRRLTSHPADDIDPAWSSDGTQVAFASTRSDAVFDIWQVRVADDGPAGPARPVTDRFAVENGPDWFPGSSRLAIASNHLGGNRDLFAIDTGDADVYVQLTSGFAFDFAPSISPDGRSIAFYRRDFCPSCPDDRGQADLVTMDRAGGSLRYLTRTDGRDDIEPDWAPDGRAIVYGSGPPGKAELVVSSPDGRRRRPLTDGWTDAIDPSWGTLAVRPAASPVASGEVTSPSSED